MCLSVIIPTYNRCSLLQEAIGSARRQNMPPCEIIVCDDGSTDGTAEFVQKHDLVNASDGRIQLLLSATADRRGAQVARNRGMTAARGKWIMFLDSDDAVVAGGVATLVEHLQKDLTLDYAYGKIIRTDEKLKPLPGMSPVGKPFSDAPVDVAGWHWPIMGAVYRKSYLEKVGPWNEALTGSQDWEYQARVKLAGGRRQFVDTLVGYWRMHGDSRVGTRVFRYDYTYSVIKACQSIAQHARQAGRYDRALANRLGGKMFLHGLEFSVNGFPEEARSTFNKVKSMPEISPQMRALMSIFAFNPRFVNWCAFRTLRAIKG